MCTIRLVFPHNTKCCAKVYKLLWDTCFKSKIHLFANGSAYYSIYLLTLNTISYVILT